MATILCSVLTFIVLVILSSTVQTVTCSSSPETDLHCAAATGNMELIFKFLANRTTAIDTPNGQEETALYLALKHNQSEAVRVLLDNCANVNILLTKSRTLLHLASTRGDLTVAEQLVNRYGFKSYKSDEDGQTPLHYATAGGHLKLVRFLMDHGARHVYAWNSHTESPLDYAALINHPIEESFALQLVQLFANYPNLQGSLTSECSNSFLFRVIEFDYRSVIHFLLNQTTFDLNQAVHRGGFKLLHYCAMTGNVEMAKLLLDNGANVDGTSSVANVEFSGGSVDTPLELAVQKGHLEMVKLLLEKENFNSNSNSTDNSNSNSNSNSTGNSNSNSTCNSNSNSNSSSNITKLLSLALHSNQTDMVYYFLSLGANLSEGVNHFMGSNPHDFFGLSTNANLSLLVLSDEHTFGQILRQRKLHDGYWLNFAINSHNLDVIKFLVDVKQIVLNITDWTHYYSGIVDNTAIVDYLVAKGALDVKVKDRFGHSLLYTAIQKGQLDMARHLITTYRLDISSDSNLTQCAIEANSTALFEYLIGQGAPLPKMDAKVRKCWRCNPWRELSLLHTAAFNGNLDIFKYLFEQLYPRMRMNITELFNTVIDNDHQTNLNAQLELLKWIVSNHHQKPIKFDFTNSALYNAIVRNKLPIVRYLLDELHFREYNQTFGTGYRLADSTVPDWLPVVKLLVDRLNVSVLPSSWHRALSLANLPMAFEIPQEYLYTFPRTFPQYTVIKYLIFDYRNVQAQNGSIVHTIAAQGNVDLLERIVRFGADLAVVDTLGRTPLHVAAMNGQVEVVKWLLHNHKCSAIGTKDANQETALDLLAHYVTST